MPSKHCTRSSPKSSMAVVRDANISTKSGPETFSAGCVAIFPRRICSCLSGGSPPFAAYKLAFMAAHNLSSHSIMGVTTVTSKE